DAGACNSSQQALKGLPTVERSLRDPPANVTLTLRNPASAVLSAQQARPAEKALRDSRGRVEAELTQLDDVERRAELATDLLFAHHRRPRVVRLAGVAGEHQAGRAG